MQIKNITYFIYAYIHLNKLYIQTHMPIYLSE